MTTYTLVTNPKHPLPADFLNNLPHLFHTQGTLIYSGRNQIKVFDVNGQKINVKKFCIPSIFNRLVYSLGLRTPKAKAAYENALQITLRGFQTPLPLGYILEKKGFLLTHSYLVTRHLTDYTALSRANVPADLLPVLARFTADLHTRGLLHLDYTPHNILMRYTNGRPSFALIDVNQFYFSVNAVRLRRALPYLINFFVDEPTLSAFVGAYARCRGFNPEICAQAALKLRRGRTAWSRFKKILKKLPFSSLFQTKRLDKKA